MLLHLKKRRHQRRNAPGRHLTLHYHNPHFEADYPRLHLWAWDAFKKEQDIPAVGVDEFGAIFKIPRSAIVALRKGKQRIGFKFKVGAGRDGVHWLDMDRHWHPALGWTIYIVHNEATPYRDPRTAFAPQIRAAYWERPTQIDIHFTRPPKAGQRRGHYRLASGAKILSVEAITAHHFRLKTEPLALELNHDITFKGALGPVHAGLYPQGIVDTAAPVHAPLGVQRDGQSTTFNLWAPRASSVHLHLSRRNSGSSDRVETLLKNEQGIWQHTLPEDLAGFYYWYHVDGPTGLGEGFDRKIPLSDPYARWVRSDDRDFVGRGLITGPKMTPIEPLKPRPAARDLVIYELHIRDLCQGSGLGPAQGDGGYLDWTRWGLKTPAGHFAGLDHLKDLGVNAVQLLPIHAFPWPKAPYNWGYFTANFFAPMDTYATGSGMAALEEFQAMINALHAQGMAVILDVVFNHSAEGDHSGPTFNFRGLDSKYYYRQDPQTFHFHNGSGVGNELHSNRPMVRRLIVDACRYWVEEFGVDGFRFDLMALLDLETLQAIADALPDDIYLYGEPWAAGIPQWQRYEIQKLKNYAVFNDGYRDAIKGSPEGLDGGFIQGQGKIEPLKAALLACCDGPVPGEASCPQDIRPMGTGLQYLTCHDNLTLNDKLEVSVPDLTEAEKMGRAALAAYLLLTSPGPILLNGGMDFLRSKAFKPGFDGRAMMGLNGSGPYDANAYMGPLSTNALDWRRKDRFFDLYALFKHLIHLRSGEAARPLRQRSPQSMTFLEDPENGAALAYWIAGEGQGSDYLIALNAHRHCPAYFHLDGQGTVLLDGLHAPSAPPCPGQRWHGPQLKLEPLGAMMLRLDAMQKTPGPQEKPHAKGDGETP